MSYWRLFYHLVWRTKHSEPLILPSFEAALHNIIAAKAHELGAFVYAVGGLEDHLHLVASVPPHIALSHFVGQIKGSSSYCVTHTLATDGCFAWQNEYGALSFSGRQLDPIVKYVRNQREHHHRHESIPALERTTASQPRRPAPLN